MGNVRSVHIRRAIYLITLAGMPFLVAFGLTTEDTAATILGVLGSMLAPGIAFTYSSNTAAPVGRHRKVDSDA